MEAHRSGDPASLTHREREILSFVWSGMSSRAIASHLGLSPRTVDAHLAAAMDKLGVSTRLRAAAIVCGSRPPARSAPELDEEVLALLRLLASGRTLREAADELGLATRTASRRLAHAREALGVRSTVELLQRVGLGVR